MFIGHYGVALAATAIDRRARLWMTVGACQLVDIGWGLLVVAGIERARLDPSLPFMPYVLDDMPWTHSVPAALAWSVAGFAIARQVLRIPLRPAVLVGLTVFSHWLCDFIVHRPDLPLWFGGPKVGLGIWDFPGPAQVLEIGLLAVGGAAATARRVADGRSAVPLIAFIALLVLVQLVAILGPKMPSPLAIGGSTVITLVVLTGIAAVADRPKAGDGRRADGREDGVPA